MAEPTYADRVGRGQPVVAVIHSEQLNEDFEAQYGYRDAVVFRIPASSLASGAVLEHHIIISTGAPDTDWDSAPLGSKYLNSTTGVWYIKTAAGNNWSFMSVTQTYAGIPTDNLVPLFRGCFCYDTANDRMYHSTGVAVANWRVIA